MPPSYQYVSFAPPMAGVHDQYAEGPGAIMHAFFHELVM